MEIVPFKITKKMNMKKLALSVFATFVIYALLYVTWSFAHWNFNPKDWEMGSRVLYCFISTAAATFANMGIVIHDDKKN